MNERFIKNVIEVCAFVALACQIGLNYQNNKRITYLEDHDMSRQKVRELEARIDMNQDAIKSAYGYLDMHLEAIQALEKKINN